MCAWTLLAYAEHSGAESSRDWHDRKEGSVPCVQPADEEEGDLQRKQSLPGGRAKYLMEAE